jgi:hypothetical protein
MGRRLLDCSRWLLLASVILSVWLWGGTRLWTRDVIRWVLLADTALFAIALVLIGRLPRIAWPAATAAMGLLAGGGFLCWNAHAYFDPNTLIFTESTASIPSLPGFLDRALVLPELLLNAGLLGTFVIASDLSANREWRRRLWITIAVTGVSFVILGLAQRLSDAPAIFWNITEDTGRTFFGTYRYHANAGAFLNLVLPMTAGLALLALGESAQFPKAFWTAAAILIFASCFVNVSKGAEIISLLILLGGLPWLLLTLRSCHSSGRGTWARILPWLGIVIFGGFFLAWSCGVETSLSRWESAKEDEGRIRTYDAIIHHTLPRTGWFGSGPGTFEQVQADEIARNHLPIEGRWDKAHSDHLQILVEWGAWGYALWLVILGGACVRGVTLSTHPASPSRRALSVCGVLALAGILLHACADFPLQIVSLQIIALSVAGLLWGTPSEDPDIPT